MPVPVIADNTTEVPTIPEEKGNPKGYHETLFRMGEFTQFKSKKNVFQSSPYGRITVNQTIRDYQDQVENDNTFGEILID